MKSTDFLMIIAVVAVAFATVNLIVTINKIGDIKSLTGFATDTGTANLTIPSQANINFTTANLSWGTGNVDGTNTSCELNSEGVMNGSSFANVSTGLILENIGNVNLTLNLTSDKNAATFIGGDTVTPIFEWKVSDNETDSCAIATNITSYTTVAVSTTTLACENFGYNTDADTLEIDIRLVIPANAVGSKGALITATATAT